MVTQTLSSAVPAQFCSGSTTTLPCVTTNRMQSRRTKVWYRQKLPYRKTLPMSDVQMSYTSEFVSWAMPGYRANGVPSMNFSEANWLSSVPSAPLSQAQLACLEKVPQSTFNAPVFTAEAGKTIEMIFESARTLATAYKAVRKGKVRDACRALGIGKPKGASGDWLAYRYGWMPLLSDVKSAAEAAAYHWFEGEPPVSVYKRITQESVVNRLQYSLSSSNAPRVYFSNGYELIGNSYSTYLVEARAGLTLQSKSSVFQTLEQFGLLNPAVVAWELVPFSFVADWFVGIGDYLASRTALAGWSVLDGWSSTLRSGTFDVRAGNRATGGQIVTGITPRGVATIRKYDRLVWDGSPPSWPVVNVNLNLNRVADAASLIRQVFFHK